MRVTFRQMQLFQALADTGSVSAAARALHVTQPTASMQLREVTESVGLPLYEVIGKRVHLTDAGKQLAQTIRHITGEWERFEQQVSAIKGLTRGRLSVAVVSTAKYFIPRWLGDFCEKHPSIDISLEVLNRDGVVQRLRENRDDLYVMSQPPADIDLHDQSFLDNPLLLVAPANHPLATRKQVKLSALAGERFILREKGSGTRLATDRHFGKCGFDPSRRLELGSNEALKEAVAGHLGVGVVSRHALKAGEIGRDLSILPVTGFPIRSRWHLVYPRHRQLSPIAHVFRDHLLRIARQWQPL